MRSVGVSAEGVTHPSPRPLWKATVCPGRPRGPSGSVPVSLLANVCSSAFSHAACLHQSQHLPAVQHPCCPHPTRAVGTPVAAPSPQLLSLLGCFPSHRQTSSRSYSPRSSVGWTLSPLLCSQHWGLPSDTWSTVTATVSR